MASLPAPPAPALMDEIVEEILFRIPPDDPARLLRAALVCKSWGRIVSDPGFRCRYREFHRTPPMLGFFRKRRRWSYSFVYTSSFRRTPTALPYNHEPIDARHGRVLLWKYDDDGADHLGNGFMVWDPITGGSSELPLPPSSKCQLTWNAAVLCASTDGTCDHLDCARGHFLVVYVCDSETGMFAHVYSSEAAAWIKKIFANMHTVPSGSRWRTILVTLPSALVGNALYFVCNTTVLKYDLPAQEMSQIPLPPECWHGEAILRTTEGGRLGLANISSDRVHLYLWSAEVGPEGNVGWTQRKVIKLRKLLPSVVNLLTVSPIGNAHDLDVITVGSRQGTFTIDLKSVRATKVHGENCHDIYFAYMSFYTPALGAASAEGSRTDTPHA